MTITFRKGLLAMSENEHTLGSNVEDPRVTISESLKEDKRRAKLLFIQGWVSTIRMSPAEKTGDSSKSEMKEILIFQFNSGGTPAALEWGKDKMWRKCTSRSPPKASCNCCNADSSRERAGISGWTGGGGGRLSSASRVWAMIEGPSDWFDCGVSFSTRTEKRWRKMVVALLLIKYVRIKDWWAIWAALAVTKKPGSVPSNNFCWVRRNESYFEWIRSFAVSDVAPVLCLQDRTAGVNSWVLVR